MYDGEFYDSSNAFLMQLYDVGMSSMVRPGAWTRVTLDLILILSSHSQLYFPVYQYSLAPTHQQVVQEAYALAELADAVNRSEGAIGDKSDCHSRKTATEYDSKPGIKWLSCTAK